MVLDILIARALKSLGRNEEAATCLAKQWSVALKIPNVILIEYVWYPWHQGALRYLPERSELLSDNEGGRILSLLWDAVEAKSSQDFPGFIKTISKAFIEINDGDAFQTIYLSFFARLLEYNSYATEKSISQVAQFILNSINLLDNDSDFERFKELFQNYLDAPDKYDLFNLITWGEQFGPLKESHLLSQKLLLEEDFKSALTLAYKEKKLNLPENWTLEELISMDLDSEPARDVFNLYQIIAATRLMAKADRFPLEPMYMKVKELKSNWNPKLFTAGSNWQLCLLEVEFAIRAGDSKLALEVLADGQKHIRNYMGVYFLPEVRFAKEMATFFEAWAFSSPSLMQEAIAKIPRRKPLFWLHELAERLIKEQRGKLSPPSTFEEVLSSLKHLVTNIQTIASAPQITVKVKSQMEQQLQKIISKLKDQNLRIAIGGETSAGKTTFLNRIFNTNLFFVTQEEATGVPTEIRSGIDLRVEVWDKNGGLLDSYQARPEWFKMGGVEIKQEFIGDIREFISKYTRVGEPSLDRVEKVMVTLPIRDLPQNLVLIDTPGFNAHESRTAIAAKVIASSHVCIFIVDARNALKNKEMETMKATRDEIGKMFIVLNKIDLILGDDDLDCDGADSINETVDRVKKQLMQQFEVESINLYPVCSLAKEEVPPELMIYGEQIDELREKIFSETLSQQLELFIDAAAKESLIAANAIFAMADSIVTDFQQNETLLEKAIPSDPKLFETEINERIKGKLRKLRSEYIDQMEEEIKTSINLAIDRMAAWMRGIYTASVLKKEAAGMAQKHTDDLLKQLDKNRKKYLNTISEKVSKEIVFVFQELYQNLPFRASFDAGRISKSFAKLESSTLYQLDAQIRNIDLTESAAGAALGRSIFGEFGAEIGGWLGGTFFSKSLNEIKREIWDYLAESLGQLEDQIYEVYNRDIDFKANSSFVTTLEAAVNEQIEIYFSLVKRKIVESNQKWKSLHSELTSLKKASVQLVDVAETLKSWRKNRSNGEVSGFYQDKNTYNAFISELDGSYYCPTVMNEKSLVVSSPKSVVSSNEKSGDNQSNVPGNNFVNKFMSKIFKRKDMFCPLCGAKNSSAAKYCGNCGAKVAIK